MYSVIPWRIVASYDKDDPGGLHHWLPSSHHENIWNNRVRGPNKDLQLDCVTNIQKVIISDHGEGERLRCSCSNSQIKCRTGDVLLRYQLNRQNSE